MTATQTVTDWRAQAACMSADPELFFPISSSGPALGQVQQAKAICGGCRVQRACLDFAMATGQVHGVWGGTTEEERQRMRRGRQRGSGAAGPVQVHPHQRHRRWQRQHS